MKVRVGTFLIAFVFLASLTIAKSFTVRPPVDPNATSFSGVFALNWTAGYCYAMTGTQNDCDPAKLKLWDR
jgi:hypothetical protein